VRYRLSQPAIDDIAAILRISEQRHGRQARIRYRALLTAALRHVAADPQGALSSARPELTPDTRSFHIRRSRNESREAPVTKPVHVIFYRVRDLEAVEILRVLHERMEPSRHLDPTGER